MHKNNYARSITGLHRHKEYWDIISNEKIKNLVSKIYDKEFFYLYNSQSHWQNDVPAVEWHRITLVGDLELVLIGIKKKSTMF